MASPCFSSPRNFHVDTCWEGRRRRRLPESRREATRGNAVLVDDVATAIQRRDGRVDLCCTTGFVAFAGHRVSVLVSGSVLGWCRRGRTVAVAICGGSTVAVSVGVSVGVTVSVLVPVGLGRRVSVRVSVCLAVGVGLVGGTDRQIALHVVLGRRVRAIDLAEQAVVRVLAVGGTTRGITISGLVALRRHGEDVGLHSVLVHAAWSLGLVVGTEKIAASATWRLQNFARGLVAFAESDGEVGGSHLGRLKFLKSVFHTKQARS